MVIDNLQKMDNSYKFQNKAILEKFSEDENENPMYNGIPLICNSTNNDSSTVLSDEEW